jgi:hypothetical protein
MPRHTIVPTKIFENVMKRMLCMVLVMAYYKSAAAQKRLATTALDHAKIEQYLSSKFNLRINS